MSCRTHIQRRQRNLFAGPRRTLYAQRLAQPLKQRNEVRGFGRDNRASGKLFQRVDISVINSRRDKHELLGALQFANALGPQRPGDIRTYSRVRSTPLFLAGLLALLGAGVLTHLLVTSIRGRRRDLAILKSLGFVRRQVWTTVAWQASCVAIVSLVVGVPVGIAAGRWAWSAFAGSVGVVPEPAIPFLAAVLVVPITLVAANLVAALPAGAAGRVRAASVLRTE